MRKKEFNLQLTIYDWVYILINIFRTYLIYKFIYLFYGDKVRYRFLEYASYIIYYLLITVSYLVINIPIIMMLINIMGFIFLSLNYKVSNKQRVLSTLFIYIILLCIESFVVLITGYINFPLFERNYYTSIFGIIFIHILTYAVVLVLQNFHNIKNGKEVSLSYWISIVTILLLTLYIIMTLFYARGLSIIQIILCIFFLFVLNIVTFTLYDNIITSYEDKMEKRMLLQQNRYYENQFELMKKVLLTTRSFRHDIVNHLTIIQMMVQKNEQSRLVEYLANLLKVSNQHEKFIRSGNIIIDCILNYKLQVIEQKDIQVLLDINIPEELTIDPLDMTVILGNLLDNAINASDKLGKENRKISIIIRLDKDVLRINIKNKYNGVVLYKGDKIITSQKDKLNHGIGLMNVKNVIDKYQGIFNIEITENDFSVIVLLMR
ncbi:MAG: hypothetical protein K0S01_134 [Herbinix sp.]|nr:hypothetical protein [Herbinix sp.]